MFCHSASEGPVGLQPHCPLAAPLPEVPLLAAAADGAEDVTVDVSVGRHLEGVDDRVDHRVQGEQDLDHQRDERAHPEGKE